MKRAILAVSFGTTHADALEKAIGAVEARLAAEFPEYEVRRAFTSGMVRTILGRRGAAVDAPEEALDRLAQEGYDEVVVQPTHVIPGEEVEKLAQACQGRAHLFSRLAMGKPLLAGEADCLEVARILAAAHAGLPPRVALVLMGHGSRHAANGVYERMNELCSSKGFPHIFVGTVEARPDVEDVLARVWAAGYRQVRLAPLLLVAGDHAENDLAGEDEDSWKSIFLREGFSVSVCLKGLGEYPAVRALYAAHARAAMQE